MDRSQVSEVRSQGAGDGAVDAVHRPQPTDEWNVAGLTLRSRVLLGTSRYPSLQTLLDALDASGAELVTVAIRIAEPELSVGVVAPALDLAALE